MRKYKDEFATSVFFLGKTTLNPSIYHPIYNVPNLPSRLMYPTNLPLGLQCPPSTLKRQKYPA
jgi:hypothetical protein